MATRHGHSTQGERTPEVLPYRYTQLYMVPEITDPVREMSWEPDPPCCFTDGISTCLRRTRIWKGNDKPTLGIQRVDFPKGPHGRRGLPQILVLTGWILLQASWAADLTTSRGDHSVPTDQQLVLDNLVPLLPRVFQDHIEQSQSQPHGRYLSP